MKIIAGPCFGYNGAELHANTTNYVTFTRGCATGPMKLQSYSPIENLYSHFDWIPQL